MIDVVGAAKVVLETVVDEGKAKQAGKDTGKAIGEGLESTADASAGTFSDKFGDKLSILGAPKAAAAGAAIGTALVAGVLENAERDIAGKTLAVSLGLDAKEGAELNVIASEIYKDAWGQSFEEVQQGVAATKSSFTDLDGNELLHAARNAQIFADVFGVDVVQAAGTASVAVKQGLAKDAVEAFDLMTAAAQRVPIQFRDELQDAVTEYSVFFAGIGVSGEAAFALLAEGAQTGQIGIDKYGDAVKEFEIRVLDTSASTQDAFAQLGLNQATLTEQIAQGGQTAADAFQVIIDKLAEIEDPLEQRQLALLLFGTQLEDIGQENIPAFLDALSNGEGGLDDFKGALDDANESLDGLNPSLEKVSRTLKESFLAALDDVAAKTLEDIEDIKEAWENVQDFFSGGSPSDFNGRSSNRGGNGQNVGGATGVQRWSGGLITVGENGREVVNLPAGSDVYPHRQSEMILAGGSSGGDTYVYAPQFYGPTTGSERKKEWDWQTRYAPRVGAPSQARTA